MEKVLAPLCLLILLSCSTRKQNNETRQTNVPKALNESGENKLAIYSKRGEDDLVEKLYEEKVKSAPSLQAIEKMIDKLNDSQNDSLKAFNDFKAKNQQYYASAKSHLNSIKDSLLKREIETVVERNSAAYNNKISGLNDLVVALNNKSGSTDDRHTVLMVLISLGMMKDYQETNLPSKKPIESVIGSYNNLIQKMDSVISKNK